MLPARDGLPSVLTAGQPTIAVRLPDHDGIRALLRAAGPLAVTSANRSGAGNITTAQEVIEQLGDCVPLLLDGGADAGRGGEHDCGSGGRGGADFAARGGGGGKLRKW